MKTGSNSAFIVTFHETNLLIPYTYLDTYVDIFRGVMSLEIDFAKVSIGIMMIYSDS